MMYTLGISCYYHDSAAAILKDDKVIAAVEEERFTRKKFDDDFPTNAINFCLKEADLTPKELDSVAFYDKSVLKFERLLDNYIAVSPRGMFSFLDVIPKWIHKRLWVKEEIKKHLKGFDGKIIFPEHHLSHAAYAFFSSPFSESAILTVDGVGEWSTATYGVGEDTTIKLLNDLRWPHSGEWSGQADSQQDKILKALRKSKHEMSQQQIVKATGLHRNTVTKYMKQLRQQKKVLVREFATCLLYKIKRWPHSKCVISCKHIIIITGFHETSEHTARV